MKKSKFSESQILKIIHEADAGVPVPDVCRKHGVSTSTFYKWRAKYGGLEASQLKRLRELEEENRRLKQMYAELSLDHEILKDVVAKKS
jgi:putative transposase